MYKENRICSLKGPTPVLRKNLYVIINTQTYVGDSTELQRKRVHCTGIHTEKARQKKNKKKNQQGDRQKKGRLKEV